jgi:hypothetical protein
MFYWLCSVQAAGAGSQPSSQFSVLSSQLLVTGNKLLLIAALQHYADAERSWSWSLAPLRVLYIRIRIHDTSPSPQSPLGHRGPRGFLGLAIDSNTR